MELWAQERPLCCYRLRILSCESSLNSLQPRRYRDRCLHFNGFTIPPPFTIVQHVKTRDRVIVWTASDLGLYRVYRLGKDCVESVRIRGPVQAAIKDIAEGEGLSGGIWVRGLAGIAALFPVFRESPRYHCHRCDDFHNSDDTAEWMLLGKQDRAIAQFDFDQLPMRLTHPKRCNELISSCKDASQPQSSFR
jgi:hypothetical protein